MKNLSELNIAPRLLSAVAARMAQCALVLGASVLLQFGVSSASAASITWRSDTAGTAWTTGSNWVGGVAPANDFTTDLAVFNQTSYLAQPTVGTRKINGIVIGDGVTQTGTLGVGTGTVNNRLQVGAGGITMNANAGAARIGQTGANSGVLLGADQTWTNNSSNTLTVRQISNANITDNTTPYTVTFSGTGAGGITIEHSVTDGAAGSPVGINVSSGVLTLASASSFTGGIKVNGGLLSLAAANTFMGGLTLSSGTLAIGNAGALGGSGNLVTLKGGTVNWSAATTINSNVFFVFDGDFTTSGSGGDLTLSRPMVLTGNRTISQATGVLNLYGGISDGGAGYGFNKVGTALMRLGGINTYSGDTKISGGTLTMWSNLALQNSPVDLAGGSLSINGNLVTNGVIGGIKGTGAFAFSNATSSPIDLTLNVASGKTLDFVGAVSGTANTILIKAGLGTQIFSGTANYPGETRIDEGKLVIHGNFTGATGAVSVASGAELNANGRMYTAGTIIAAGKLSGSGTMGVVTLDGSAEVAPGNGSGKLTMTSLTGTNGAVLSLELGKTTAGSAPMAGADYDQLCITSGLALNGMTLSLTTGVSYNVEAGDKFFLILNGTGTDCGTFNNLVHGSSIALNGISYQISYTANASTGDMTGGHDVALLAVPEPSTWAMMLGGFGMLLGFQRMRRRPFGK